MTRQIIQKVVRVLLSIGIASASFAPVVRTLGCQLDSDRPLIESLQEDGEATPIQLP
jgi:hypothetical protein